ncbi:hypothetical protein ACWCPQ_16960 [Nocardia sp. NPDC001965]
MIREWISDQAELARINVQLAKRRLSNVSRDQYRKGWEEGYLIGREHERDHLPNAVDRPRGMPDHPQVEVDGIEVDEGMRDLLVALWKLELDTQFSCQGEPDSFTPNQPYSGNKAAHIVFGDISHAYKFLTKTLELLEMPPHYEGGLGLHTMTRLWPETSDRASVEFSPELLPQITQAWIEFEKTVPPAVTGA